MLALIFGLSAAVTWAVHDFLVRRLAPNQAVLPMILVVAFAGCAALAGPVLVVGGWDRMTAAAYGFGMLAGVAYIPGSLGLYMAFKLAPVRIVAPVLGAYPMLSLGIAALQGRSVGALEWVGVAAIVLGIAFVAVLSRGEDGHAPARLGPALGWAVFGAIGFAATFALGQEAARQGATLPSILMTRLVVTAGIVALVLLTRPPMAQVRGSLPTLGLMGVLDAVALGLVLAAATLPHPEYAAITSSLFGVLTILLAWKFLGERVQPLQWVGIVVVFGGIALLAAQG